MADEEATTTVRGWLEADRQIVTWLWSRVELAGGVERRARSGVLDDAGRRTALASVDTLVRSWDEVADVVAVRGRALSLLARYDLRAADAAQLGAALLLAGERPDGLIFVCLDRRLAAAADREGFRVLTRDTSSAGAGSREDTP